MRTHCKVCSHKKVAQINEKIRNGDSIASLSKLYGISRTTLAKHKNECMVKLLAEDKETMDAIVSDSLIKQVNVQIDLVHKLIGACDEWLTDPEDPTKYYLGPRGEEVDIAYQVTDSRTGEISKVQRKATLQELLQAIEGHGYIIRGVKFNHSDPRELLIKAIGKLEGTVKMIHESSRQLIEWEHKKKALERLDGGDNVVTVEEQISTITRRLTVASKKNDTESLMAQAGLPPPTKSKIIGKK